MIFYFFFWFFSFSALTSAKQFEKTSSGVHRMSILSHLNDNKGEDRKRGDWFRMLLNIATINTHLMNDKSERELWTTTKKYTQLFPNNRNWICSTVWAALMTTMTKRRMVWFANRCNGLNGVNSKFNRIPPNCSIAISISMKRSNKRTIILWFESLKFFLRAFNSVWNCISRTVIDRKLISILT